MKKAVDQGSKLVFYDHISKQWLGVRTETLMTYHATIKLLKWLFREGTIEIQAWDGIPVEGLMLYPMVVKFPEQSCHEWWLLAQRGLTEDSDWTPYLFVNSEARRKVMEMITNDAITVPHHDQMRLYL